MVGTALLSTESWLSSSIWLGIWSEDVDRTSKDNGKYPYHEVRIRPHDGYPVAFGSAFLNSRSVWVSESNSKVRAAFGMPHKGGLVVTVNEKVDANGTGTDKAPFYQAYGYGFWKFVYHVSSSPIFGF